MHLTENGKKSRFYSQKPLGLRVKVIEFQNRLDILMYRPLGTGKSALEIQIRPTVPE